MEIELTRISVRNLVSGYKNDVATGVVGYDNKLDIRPPYQREFVYKDKQRESVINSINKNFPLNVMYWSVNENDTYEVIDGQQRTISICQYVNGDFSLDDRYFHNLKKDEQDKILDYELMVYLCTGTESEKLDWFRTINIAGEKLSNQELRNAVYSGTWVTDAKKHFSRTGCPAFKIGSSFITGAPIRQEFLETALRWISDDNIESYMAKNQHEPNANELWLYFQNVINWVSLTFQNYRREMKGIQWGYLFNKYKDTKLDCVKLEEDIVKLMLDDDVTSKKGIYWYILTGKEKYLNIRAFSLNEKREAYERQKGICPVCGKHFEINEMEADHITPWHKGGKTNVSNCQMLCIEDNRLKSGK